MSSPSSQPEGAIHDLIGRRAQVRHAVTDADTAVAVGSGEVQVLATPRVLAWCEEATCLALEGALPAALTSVGVNVVLEHRAPSWPGDEVIAVAQVATAEARRITFAVELSVAHRDASDRADGADILAVGTIVRALVPRSRFSRQAEA